MRALWLRLSGLVLGLFLCAGPVLACVARGFDGAQALAPWDTRNALAQQIEANGPALGLSDEQGARLAWALRLGSLAAPALTSADLAALRALDRTCDDPPDDAVSAPEPSFGFDLRTGWRQLVVSGAITILALAGLIVGARIRAIRRRRRKRYVCARPVQCQIAEQGPRDCRVEDISIAGVRVSLRGAQAMAVGADVWLDFGGVQLGGRVAWASRHFTGIDFDRTLTRAELLHLVRPEKYPAPPVMQRHPVALDPG